MGYRPVGDEVGQLVEFPQAPLGEGGPAAGTQGRGVMIKRLPVP